jgi:hypothetical protein
MGSLHFIQCGAARQTIMCGKWLINILGVLGLLQEQNHLKIVAVIMTILVVVVVLITLVMLKRVVIAVAVIKVSYKIPSYIIQDMRDYSLLLMYKGIVPASFFYWCGESLGLRSRPICWGGIVSQTT